MLLRSYFTALLVFFALDMVWLGFIAKDWYRKHLGFLIGNGEVHWPSAIIFYLLFILGLVVFVITPALEHKLWFSALWKGALFGLVTYATYDLTNMATIKDWPLNITIIDLIWGTFLATSVSVITYFTVLKMETSL